MVYQADIDGADCWNGLGKLRPPLKVGLLNVYRAHGIHSARIFAHLCHSRFGSNRFVITKKGRGQGSALRVNDLKKCALPSLSQP